MTEAATLKNERDKLATELKAAQNKIRDLYAQLSLVEGERDRFASLANQQSEERSLPDAADLLNQLKGQSKKSKASLADVTALLRMIFEP